MTYSLTARAVLVCGAFVAALTALSVHLIDVQVVRHKSAMDKVKARPGGSLTLPPQRGDILDRRGEPLVTSRPLQDLCLDKFQLPQGKDAAKIVQKVLGPRADAAVAGDESNLYFRALARRLSRPIQQEEAVLVERMTDKRPLPPIAEKLEPDLARALVAELAAEGFGGLTLTDSYERLYVSGDLASHVIGYVNEDMSGAYGVEKTLDNLLRGTPGKRRLSGAKVTFEEPPQHGANVALTLDTALQNIVERELDRQWAELRPHKLCAILMRPHTGEILALANRPAASPASVAKSYDASRWDNVAVSFGYEPGSTFKLVVHAAAMDQGVSWPTMEVDCHGGVFREESWPANWSLRDVHQGFGWTQVRDVLAESLNTGTFEVAKRLKPEVYYNYIRSFGFGERTGVQLSAEVKGSVVPFETLERSRLELSRLGMGYSVSATPLQILAMVNVFANQGHYVKPRVVSRVTGPAGNVLAEMPTDVVERVVSAKTANWMVETLIHCVEDGTGKEARIPGFVVGGKTGTADKLIRGKYDSERTVCSFLGFAGVEESIELIAIVLVDDPNPADGRKKMGGAIAAPIFREICAKALHQMGHAPDEGLAAASQQAKSARSKVRDR